MDFPEFVTPLMRSLGAYSKAVNKYVLTMKAMTSSTSFFPPNTMWLPR
ncbi:MAG: hypothetical protein IKH98_05170 [Candidatus Methanomethylophilaceae archaeon]|nr:hypothetical protein [Candidatus Methanomethylophilaceae archaeon]